MQIRPITHEGHTTTYNYEIDRDGQTYRIRALDPSSVSVTHDGKTESFSSLKSALNFALGAED